MLSWFFVVVGFWAVVWVVMFRFWFTKRCTTQQLRDMGVSQKKTHRTFLELKRKSFHLAGLLIPIIYFLSLRYRKLTQTSASVLLGSVTAFLWVVELLRLLSDNFRILYNKVFGSMLRSSELKTRQFTGTGFFFLGSFLTVRLFEPIIAIASMLFLILGDLSAALVGVSIGRTKISGKKSLEGTLACFVACFLIGVVCFWRVPMWEYCAFVGALTAALVELLNPVTWDDNLTIPLSSACALHLALLRCGSPDLPLHHM